MTKCKYIIFITYINTYIIVSVFFESTMNVQKINTLGPGDNKLFVLFREAMF